MSNIVKTMQAVVLKEQGKPLLVRPLVIPKLEVGQVLVRVKATSICGAQIHEVIGTKGDDPYLPHLLGHEGAGIVKAIGEGVKHVKIGDRVVMHWRKGIGIDAVPAAYKDHETGERIGAGPVSTFAEYAIVSENRVTPISEDIPFDIASLFGCAITTGLGLINNEAQLKIGQSIAVVGCGGVGLNIIQGASMVSANPIIALDIVKEKLYFALSIGASHIVNLTNDTIQNSILKINGSKGVDVFVDCTGVPEVICNCVNATAPGGKVILVGQPSHDSHLVLQNFRQHYCGKTILDSQGGLTNPTLDIPRYLRLYSNGSLKLDKLITHRFPLEDINEAFKMLLTGETGRVVLES
jgi:S-(hydroxymethyl)glutathione dehydrogenase / alcohol dehydrogenase